LEAEFPKRTCIRIPPFSVLHIVLLASEVNANPVLTRLPQLYAHIDWEVRNVSVQSFFSAVTEGHARRKNVTIQPPPPRSILNFHVPRVHAGHLPVKGPRIRVLCVALARAPPLDRASENRASPPRPPDALPAKITSPRGRRKAGADPPTSVCSVCGCAWSFGGDLVPGHCVAV
jgi:hypothetical protein